MELHLEGNYKPNLLHDELATAEVLARLNWKEAENGVSIDLEFLPADWVKVNDVIAAHNPTGESKPEANSRRFVAAVDYLKSVDWDILRDEIIALPAAVQSPMATLAKTCKALTIVAAQLESELE